MPTGKVDNSPGTQPLLIFVAEGGGIMSGVMTPPRSPTPGIEGVSGSLNRHRSVHLREVVQQESGLSHTLGTSLGRQRGGATSCEGLSRERFSYLNGDAVLVLPSSLNPPTNASL